MSSTSGNGRRIAAWILGFAALALAGLAACELAGWPFLKGPMQRQLTQRLDRPVTFGDQFRLTLFRSIRLDTSALRIGPPSGQDAGSPLGGDLVNAQQAHLELPYATVRRLMKGDTSVAPRIASLRFGQVDANVKRLADGQANWTMGRPQAVEAGRHMPLPAVDELVIRNGHIRFEDAIFKTELEASVSTSEGQVADGRATGLNVQGRGRHQMVPFEFHVASTGVLPLVASGSRDAVPIAIRLAGGDNARFSFDGTATDVFGFEGIDGDASLSGPSLAKVGDTLGLTLPNTEAFTLRGHLSKSGARWSLNKAGLTVGDSRLRGNFSLDRSPKVPLLRGELNGSRLVLSDLLPAFGAPKPGTVKAKAQVARQGGKVLPDKEFDIPSLHAMNAEVKVRLARAELGSLFQQPLAPVEADLSLQSGVLKLSNLLARTSGGELKGQLGLDANPANPLWTADVRWAGIELDQWLRPRNKTSQTPKTSGENPGYVTGRLGGHADLQARGRSTAKMIASTDGTVQAWVRDGTISHLVVEGAGLDLAQGLGLLLVGDDPLPMHCAVVKAQARDGLLRPEVAMVDTRDSTLFIEGTVSLADERLALTMTAKPKDMSPAALRSPVHVDGTFSTPQVHLEKKPIAIKALAALALASVHPLATIIALFDPGDKEAAGGCRKALDQLRDANGPPGARDAKAPKASG